MHAPLLALPARALPYLIPSWLCVRLPLPSRLPSVPLPVATPLSCWLDGWAQNSHGGIGTFYEGALTKGYSTDATDTALHENIVAAGYGK